MSGYGFKAFNLREDVRASHAAKFMNYEEKYHHKLAMEARRQLIDAWQQKLSSLESSLDKDSAERAAEVNPNGTLKMVIISSPEKVTSSRWMSQRLIGPSVKIPAFYSVHDRRHIISTFLDTSKQVLKTLVSKTGKVLNLDGEDQLPSLFRVVADGDDVKLQFVSKKGGHETSKTIFKVAVEHGRPGSKTKDFDRVFFIDNLMR